MEGSHILGITLLFVLDVLFAQDRTVLAMSVVRITGKYEQEATQNGYLKCEVTEPAMGTDYSLKWYNPIGQFIPFQGEINSSERLYASRESMFSVSLNFMPVREHDAGFYTCTAMINGQPHNGTFKITIFTDITFSNCPLEQKIISGNNQATLSCSASAGGIDLTTFWMKRDQPLQIQDDGNKYAITSAGLIIFNISKTDEAIYKFHAKYDKTFSWEYRSITVKVLIKPEIVYPPVTIATAKAGDQFSMFCNASGDSIPIYFWYKEGTTNQWSLLMDSDRMVIDKLQGELKIKSLRKDDEGQYKCQASNEAGFAEAQARLDVQVLPDIIEVCNGTGEENGGAVISCRASGDQAPEIKWKPIDSDTFYPEGQSGDITVTLTKNQVNHESTAQLKFENLKPSDMGDYMCQAHNSHGYDTGYGHLSVRYAAKFNNQPQGPFYNWYGNDKGNVTCVMNGNPLPVVQWFKGGNQITGQTSYAIKNIEEKDKFQVTSILLAKLDLSSEQQILGDYICKGINAVGTNNITIQMVQAEKPHAPVVSVDYYTTDTIRLAINVTSVQGPPVTKFNIRYMVQGSNDNPMTAEAPVDWRNYVDDQPVPRTNITLDNLAVKTQYNITVTAVNDVGESAPFEFTQATRPYSVLQLLEITSFPDSPSPTSFLLMWNKPVDGGSEIQKYILGYRKVEIIPNKIQYELSKPLSEFIYVNDILPTAVKYLLSSLTPGTYYQVEVRTVYIQGISTLQSYIFKTKEDPAVISGSPLLFTTSTILTITLTALIAYLQVFM